MTIAPPGSGIRSRVRERPPTGLLLGMLAPSAILLLALNAYPLIYAVSQSLRNGTLISNGTLVGTANFTGVLADPSFWGAARFTLVFSAVGVFGSWVLGLAFALILRANRPEFTVLRTVLLLPWVVPIVVSAASWNWLVVTKDSLVPTLMRAVGFGTPLFLADPTLAAIIVCVVKVWVSYPFMMVTASAALASIDQSVYDASIVDGANAWQRLRLITLPLIRPTTLVSWVLMTIFCVNDFATPYLLTGGGPFGATTTLSILSYERVFQSSLTGPGVAISLIMTVVLIAVAALLLCWIRKSNTA